MTRLGLYLGRFLSGGARSCASDFGEYPVAGAVHAAIVAQLPPPK
jgi:hypothetical protein